MVLNLIFGVLEVGVMAGGAYYFMSHINHEIEKKESSYIVAFSLYGLLTFIAILLDQYLMTRFFTIGINLLYGIGVGYMMFSRRKTYLCYCGIYIICVHCCQAAVSIGLI